MDLSKLNLEALTIKELTTLKQKLEEDMRVFLDTKHKFLDLKRKYQESKILVQNLKKKEPVNAPQEIFVPLSNSVYIPGEIRDRDSYIVDIGTGYYAERNSEQTVEYCEQTCALLDQNILALDKEIRVKKEFLDKLNFNIQKKVLKARGIE